jgi:uncharacterized membrane-anchored protein YjiN (DUF445 family)
LTPPAALPPVRQQAAREGQLRTMKRRATGLLVVTTGLFLVVTVVGHGHGGWGYAQAGLEASMVGGLADWFAVTALFRRPLGLPIPHTAIIRERKDQFGQTLGNFVQENFLTIEVVSERVRSSHIVERVAAWLAQPANGEVVAGHLADVAVGLADVVSDDDVHRLVGEGINRWMDTVPLAPLAGRGLRLMTAQGRHQELLDTALRELARLIEEHHDVLRARFSRESPWWMPETVEHRIFEHLLDNVRQVVREVNADPAHELRLHLNKWVDDLIERLEHSPELLARGEQLKHDLLANPELGAWTSSLWADLKTTLRSQSSNPQSELRRRLAVLVAAGGRRLADEPALRTRVEAGLDSAVSYLAGHFHEEMAALVSGTIARWDGAETSQKLELLLGPDLQFIRINGTVVGGLAGLAIYGVSRAIG